MGYSLCDLHGTDIYELEVSVALRIYTRNFLN